MNKYLTIIFLIYFSIIFSQNDVIDIANFYEPVTQHNHITLDPNYSTSFLINTYNPNNTDDIELYDIKIDGSMLTPLGSYITSPLLNNFMKDTISSTAFEHSRGDYAFNENIIFIDKIVDSTLKTIFVAQSKKYDGLQSINSNSDALQNYFFNLSKKHHINDDLNLSLSSTILYHKENTIIPLKSSSSYIRYSEDYLAGITFQSNYKNTFIFMLNNSFQNGRGNFYNSLNSDRFCNWINFYGRYSYNENIDFLMQVHNKKNSIENLTDTNEFLKIKTIINEYVLSAKLKHKNKVLKFSVYKFDHNYMDDFIYDNDQLNNIYLSEVKPNRPKFNFDFLYKYSDDISLTLKRFTKSFIYDYTKVQQNDINSLLINYKKNWFEIFMEPFYLSSYYNDASFDINSLSKEGEIIGINSFLMLEKKYLIVNLKSSIYNSNYKTPLDYYFNYSILFAPKYKDKRFRPFLGLNGIFSKINSSNFIDFSNDENSYIIWNNLINDNNQSSSKNVSLINLELGLMLNQFKISYHFTNPLSEDILFSYSELYQSIPFFSKLQVTWQFLD